jgi:hypothetical protein
MVMDRFCDICVDNNFFDVIVEEKKSVDEYCWVSEPIWFVKMVLFI